MSEDKKTEQLNYAQANDINVLETNVLHASDVIYWLDGATAQLEQDMNRISSALDIHFFQKPRDATLIHGIGKSVVLRKPVNNIIEGYATENERTRPVQTPYIVSGEVWDVQRMFNPAQFEFTLGSGNGHSLILYPSPTGVSIPSSGSVFGSMLIDNTELPLIWALIEIQITVSLSETQIYRAQTNAKGDFSIAFNRLPPLPESVASYDATLQVTGNMINDEKSAPDTASYSDFELQSENENSFSSVLSLNIIPGEIKRINSNDKEYLSAQTA